ncbi:SRPBCC family protein [Pendulispora albinea]|uniref:SRPBCC family protein n=1 Tax=Pendulispora albinea TaxID=2741071 RepID=A0ABZ2MBM9_9BACT
MRTEVSESVVVDVPMAKVWHHYDDLEAFRRWAPNVVDVKVIGETRRSLGARMQFTLKFGPFHQKLDETITRYEPPRASSLTGRAPGWTYEMALDLVEEPGGTRATYRCLSDYSRIMRPLVPLLDRMNRRMLGTALAALKSAVERERE